MNIEERCTKSYKEDKIQAISNNTNKDYDTKKLIKLLD